MILAIIIAIFIYGYQFAFYQRRYYTLARKRLWVDFFQSILLAGMQIMGTYFMGPGFAVGGLIGTFLMRIITMSVFKYGFKWIPNHENI